MSTELDLDIAALVGAMEAPPCESIGHGVEADFHNDGPAESYVKVSCEPCARVVVKAYCGTLVAYINAGGRLKCPECASAFTAVEILGPVNK